MNGPCTVLVKLMLIRSDGKISSYEGCQSQARNFPDDQLGGRDGREHWNLGALEIAICRAQDKPPVLRATTRFRAHMFLELV